MKKKATMKHHNTKDMKPQKNEFDSLKSKIRDLHIPLPNFKYFHKPSSEEEVFDNFIGREENAERLEELLTSGDSGAYLVTGYRGMGKSSLVGKVLNKITITKKGKKIGAFHISAFILFIFWIYLFYMILLSHKSDIRLLFAGTPILVFIFLLLIVYIKLVLLR